MTSCKVNITPTTTGTDLSGQNKRKLYFASRIINAFGLRHLIIEINRCMFVLFCICLLCVCAYVFFCVGVWVSSPPPASQLKDSDPGFITSLWQKGTAVKQATCLSSRSAGTNKVSVCRLIIL